MKKKFIPLIFSITSIAFSTFATLLPLAGFSQKDISDKYFTIITPASFTFSIWSVIYISWIVISIMILRKKVIVSKMETILFSSAMLMSSLWLIPWHYQVLWLSLITIFILVGILIYLFLKSRTSNNYFKLTIELFMGWILAATILNFASFCLSLGINVGLLKGSFLLLTGLIINIFFYINYKSYVSLFVFTWALLGIYVGQDSFMLRNIILIYFTFIAITLITRNSKICKFKKDK